MTAALLGRNLRWRNGLPVFASTTERDAIFLTAARAGDACYVDDGTSAEGLQVHNGVSWRPGFWNAPWGVVAQASSTSDQTGISALADITFATATWTAVAGRLYRVTLSVRLVQVTSVGTQEVQIQTGASGAGTILSDSVAVSVPVGFAGIGTHVTYQTASGSTSVHARANTSAGTVTVQNSVMKGWFVVEDAGPIGGPA